MRTAFRLRYRKTLVADVNHSVNVGGTVSHIVPTQLEFAMKFPTLVAAAAAVIGCAGLPALAQSSGEADPAQSRAAPAKKATPAEKAAARQARRKEGAEVARSATGADDNPSSAGAARKYTREDRKAAAAKRRSDTSAAVKRGEISSGDNQ